MDGPIEGPIGPIGPIDGPMDPPPGMNDEAKSGMTALVPTIGMAIKVWVMG